MENGSKNDSKHFDLLLPGLKMAKGWEEVDASEIKLTPLSAAMTNHVYRCEKKGSKKSGANVLLGRVYGDSGGLFDRELEIERFKHIHEAGVGPKLLAILGNGRIEEFEEDHKATHANELRGSRTSMYIACKMGEFHCKMLDYYKYNADVAQNPGEMILWSRIEEWYQKACSVNRPLIEKLGLTDLMDQVEVMRSDFSRCKNKWICFCHNDLQHGNIMRSYDETNPGVKLIDFEYSGFNPIAFEIANHWCEWMCDFNSSQPHVIKRDRFPNEEQQYIFLHNYIKGVSKTVEEMGITRSDGTGGQTESQQQEGDAGEIEARRRINECLGCLLDLIDMPGGVESLHQQVLQFVPMSDLVWGLWAIIQDANCGIDFDFREYAVQRIKAYHKADLF